MKIELDVDQSKYDQSNQLILDNNSKTKNFKQKSLTKNIPKTKVLSKKQRKKLEKVLQRKNRKTNVIYLFVFNLIRITNLFWFIESKNFE